MAETPDADTDDMSWLNDQKKSLVPSRAAAKKRDKKPATTAKKKTTKKAPARSKSMEDKLRDELDNPKPAAKSKGGAKKPAGAAKSTSKPPKSGGGRSTGRGGGAGRKSGEIADNCPVTPLGVRDGHSYYLDTWGQLRDITKHDISSINILFGKDIPFLWNNFPRWRMNEHEIMEKIPEIFDQNKASSAMMMASSELGPFNSSNAVRGVGAWTTEDGDLVYHMGNELLIGGEIHKPGKHGRHIYPAYPAIPAPATDGGEGEDPVREFMGALETWNWQRPQLDPMIAMGMTGVQMLGGALKWRPTFWGTGGAGSGKSALQELINLMHGPDGVIASEDPTKSGITSRLGHSSLPVSLDEREPDTDERSSKNSDIIALARIASTGGEWVRGSSDQSGSSGKVFSAFFFSSILIPGAMKPQDVQRLIQLNLNRLPADAAPLSLVPSEWRARGAVFKRNLIDRWPTFAKRTALWRKALAGVGVQGRDADNWEVVISMADMAESAEMPNAEKLEYWVRLIAEAHTLSRADIQDDAAAMLLHLKTQTLDLNRRGDNFTVAQWIMVAGGLPSAPENLHGIQRADPTAEDLKRRRDKANETLARVGLRVTGVRESASLFIANSKIAGLNDLFKGSDWAGGSWKQSALRVDGATTSPRAKTLQGISTRGVEIPMTSISGMMTFPNSRGDAGDTSTGTNPASDTGEYV